MANAKIFQVGNWFITQCGQSLIGISLLDKILKKLVEIERFSQGLQTSFVIIDSKSITKADVTDRNGAIEMFITTSDNQSSEYA